MTQLQTNEVVTFWGTPLVCFCTRLPKRLSDEVKVDVLADKSPNVCQSVCLMR